MSAQESQSASEIKPVHDAENLVRALGHIISNTLLYGAEHGVTKKALEDGFAILTGALSSSPEITFIIAEDNLLLNNSPVELRNPLMKSLISHLFEREITNFSLLQGMSREHFDNLIEVMMAKREDLEHLGGFAKFVQDIGLEHIRAKKIVYRQVSDDDLVISKGVADKAGLKSEDDVMAFLVGAADLQAQDMRDSLHALAGDPGKLTELIFKTAAPDAAGAGDKPAGQGGAGEAGGSAEEHGGGAAAGEAEGAKGPRFNVQTAVASLKRAYECLMKDPALKTQKGKKELAKTLAEVGEGLLKKMKELSCADSEAEDAISGTVEEMIDELKMDALADDYAKKQGALSKNEGKILRFIRSRGMEGLAESDLKERLMSGGLSQEGWDSLLDRAGIDVDAGGVDTGDESGMQATLEHLALLVARVEEKAEQTRKQTEAAGSPPVDASVQQEIGTVFKDIASDVSHVMDETGHRIDKLVESVHADEKARREGKPAILSRKKIVEMLAEIVQEFCQPLSVMTCVVDSFKSGMFGPVDASQSSLLELASSSGDRLKSLINQVKQISGMPTELTPDAKMISKFYKE